MKHLPLALFVFILAVATIYIYREGAKHSAKQLAQCQATGKGESECRANAYSKGTFPINGKRL